MLLRQQPRFQPLAKPAKELLVANLLEEGELLEVAIVQLLTHLVTEGKRQFIDELLKPSQVRFGVKHQRFLDLKVQLWRKLVLIPDFVQVEQLFLQLRLLTIVV